MAFGCNTEIEMSAEARSQLKEHSNIRVIHYSPWLYLGIATTEGVVYDKIAMTDPLSSVKERFLATVQGELSLSNFDVVQDPHPTDRVLYLKQLFGQGFVLDFKTLGWQLGPYPDWYMAISMPKHYLLGYVVRARLIRTEDSTFLWQKICLGNEKFPAKQKYTLEELRANDNSLLKVKAEEAVRRCADQLTASFLGKEYKRD